MTSITIKSDKPLVLISVDEYESMKETIELLLENPRLAEELEQARRLVARGKFISWVDFKKKNKVR